MIILTILGIILIVAVIAGAISLLATAGSFLLAFGDVIVAALIIYLIIKSIIKHHK